MTVRVPFKWDANKWYRMKLRVDNRPDGTALVRGKVWPTGEAEPAAWTIEKIDTIRAPRGQPRASTATASRMCISTTSGSIKNQ